MEAYIGKIESKFEKKVEEVEQTIVDLHEDNRGARHRLRNDLNAPLVTLAANFESLRTELVRQRQLDMQRRDREASERARLDREIKNIKEDMHKEPGA